MGKTRLLITGGHGLVGLNILEHPASSNFEILAPRSFELNLQNYTSVVDYLKHNCPDIVIHAAGKVGGIQANINSPVQFLVENLDMGRNIVLASRQLGIERLINLGSSCMYPRNHNDPLSEDLILKGELEPTNEAYALAKVVTAKLCHYVSRENVTYRYKTLIPCNLYGRHDKFDPIHSHLIPAIIHKIHLAKKSGQDFVEIWGDGSAKREFMYAGDLADAIIRAINTFEMLPDIMNIGLGYDYTITEYYQAVAGVLGYTGDFVYNISKPVGMSRKLVDVKRLKAWGWEAPTMLRIGIEKTYDYYVKEFLK